MPELLFKLNNVPDDEADEVRQLLDDNGIEYYETPGGNWGISVAGIWLHDKVQLATARQLLDDYQAQRQARVREEYEQLKSTGEGGTFWRRLYENPLQVLALLALAGAVLYFSIMPFFDLK